MHTDVYCNCWIFLAVGFGILVLSNWVNRRRSFFVYLSFLNTSCQGFYTRLKQVKDKSRYKIMLLFKLFLLSKFRGKKSLWLLCYSSCEFLLQHNYRVFLRRQQNFDKISQLIWNVLSKRQINREMLANFCGLRRKPELYLQGK